MSAITLHRAGDRGVLVDLPEPYVVQVAGALRGLAGVVDIVPGHRTVLVTWGERPPRLEVVRSLAEAACREPAVEGDARAVEIPVTYDGADLELVAELVGLSVDEVVAAHTGGEYTVAFLGFAPGFGYLVGGDERLYVPRRDEPRKRVPSGSVAVAGPYSGVYPREGPGGWRLLGTTSVSMFDPARSEPALLAAGDRVRFSAR